jgi:hypothetical protein
MIPFICFVESTALDIDVECAEKSEYRTQVKICPSCEFVKEREREN